VPRAGVGEDAGDGGAAASRIGAIEARLSALEAAASDIRRRQVLAEIRSDPVRLLAGVADARRIVRDDLDDLSDVLARWESPLSPDELTSLQRAALVAQAVAGPQAAKLHLVVEVVVEVTASDLERTSALAGLLSSRSRRAVPVVVSLAEPEPDVARQGAEQGVEIVVAL